MLLSKKLDDDKMMSMTLMMTKIMMMGLLPLCGVVRLDCGARAHLLLQREGVEGF